MADFTRRWSANQSREILDRIEKAIRQENAEGFRAVMQEIDPAGTSRECLYSVLYFRDGHLKTLLVDENGEKLPAGYIIPAGMPIDLVNVEFGETEITVRDPDNPRSISYSAWNAVFGPNS